MKIEFSVGAISNRALPMHAYGVLSEVLLKKTDVDVLNCFLDNFPKN